MEMDTKEDVSNILSLLKTPGEDVHGCLDCDPCPPADLYAKYVHNKSGLNI